METKIITINVPTKLLDNNKIEKPESPAMKPRNKKRFWKLWKPSECTPDYNKAIIDQILTGLGLIAVCVLIPSGASFIFVPIGAFEVIQSIRGEL